MATVTVDDLGQCPFSESGIIFDFCQDPFKFFLIVACVLKLANVNMALRDRGDQEAAEGEELTSLVHRVHKQAS
jgi:hypothetical protein